MKKNKSNPRSENYTQTDTEIGTTKINQKKSNNGVKRCREKLKQKFYQEPTNDERNGETSYEKTSENTCTKEQDSIKGIENSNRQRRKQANKQIWKNLTSAS